ncbi:hypothetical protein O181_040365 [Austropuccinia psidii MF-1]|uniref:Uncharacterized protein n=1 Tax=Austropuccinia psidii MF-1 TaxID=1389203 RepID=A0A9Q3HG24_9BASI|nr:hypothetical protein [Austropuccinia psidii MF-1]
MESTIIQISDHKDKGMAQKRREASKEKAPVSSTSKTQANQPPQEVRKNKKRNWRKPYFPSYRFPKIQSNTMGNGFNMSRTFMELKENEEQRMRQPSFPNK